MIQKTNEPRHDKSNKMRVRQAKTQISLSIRQVLSESSLCAQWVAKDPFFLPIRLNLRGGHQTGFGIQVQRGGG